MFVTRFTPFSQLTRRTACALLFATSVISHAEPTLTLTTEHMPPYNVVSHDLHDVTGLAADKVKEVLRRAQVDYVFAPSGWNRAIMLAQTQPDTCVFSTGRIPERETWFKWVVPLAETSRVIYTRYAFHTPATKLEDLKDAKISAYRSDADSMILKTRGYQVSDSESYEDSLSALLAGRVDYWATDRIGADALLASKFAHDKVHLLLTFGKMELYLACNPSVSDSTIDKIRVAYRKMTQDGTLQRIDARYSHP
ncbi:MAG: ABC transporter substrate-binding protein [Burkholderiales bacterium]|nr:ABC transporter substrate-binding protein [Burkholderiales bacterium]